MKLRLGPLELEDAGRPVHSKITQQGPVGMNHIPLEKKNKPSEKSNEKKKLSFDT